MTLHPTAVKLDVHSSLPVKPALLFKLISYPEFMFHVVLAACGYRVEEKEVSSLPETLQALQEEGASTSTPESQFKALELLSWMVGVHLSNTNRLVCFIPLQVVYMYMYLTVHILCVYTNTSELGYKGTIVLL